MTALFALYVAAIAVARGRRLAEIRTVTLASAALFQVAAVLAPSMLSGDLYSYVFYGRMLVVHGGNPYLEVPAQYASDPYYSAVFWKFAPSFYGPLWTVASGGLAGLAGENVGLAVLLFKGVAAGSALGTAFLIAMLLERRLPRSAAVGTLLFAWNPLLVIEAGLGGHNDAVMVLFIVLGLAFATTRRPVLAVAALILAGLIKYVALMFLPLLGLYIARRQGWRERALFGARSAALASGLSAAIIAPVWAGPATFAAGALGTSGERYVNGLGELALGELRVLQGETREDTEVPLQFRGWWVAAHTPAPLRTGRTDGSAWLGEVGQWDEILVVGPERDGWLRVYDPRSGRTGYVPAAALGPADRPEHLAGDAEVLRREAGPQGSAALQRANGLLRVVGWGGFGLVWLGAMLLGTGSLRTLAVAGLASSLALYYLVSAWFWPWYVLWGLPFAALAPSAWPTRWLILLSWSVLILYASLGFENTELWYLQTYRALGAFGLPLAGLAVDGAARAVVRRRVGLEWEGYAARSGGVEAPNRAS